MAGDMVTTAATATRPTTANKNVSSHRKSNASDAHNNAPVDTAVDTYASIVLRIFSPAESNIDSNLGPYVCSILRNSVIEQQRQQKQPHYGYLEEIPESDSILELLEEHCGMGIDEAKNALWIIVTSVQTGDVDENFVNNRLFLSSDTTADTTTSHEDFEMIHSISQMIDEVVIDDDEEQNYPSPSQSEDSQYQNRGCLEEENYYSNDKPYNWNSNANAPTPLKPSTLIPADLLAVMDDDDASPVDGSYDIVPPIISHEEQTQNNYSPNTLLLDQEQKQVKEISKPVTAQDLAASLFRPSRSRSNSILSDKQKTVPSPQLSSSEPSLPTSNHMYPSVNQNQMNSVVEILFSMNNALSEDAALAAAAIAIFDVNLAQYVIEAAMNAPPVCRHMLNEGCYRSDCQFSHDVDGNTCLFWLRGRCGKYKCRFLHGFSENLLEGVNVDNISGVVPTHMASNSINTTNLLQHNNMICQPTYETYSSSNKSLSNQWKSEAFDASSPYSLCLKADQYSSNPESFYSSNSPPKPPSSFASVATKGYNHSSSYSSQKEISIPTSVLESPISQFAKIPLNLLNPNYNRNSALFHISDPIERFQEVSHSNKSDRSDAIDLHFQSIKTFPIVLNAILPERLIHCKDGVWIITGSGHHVNRTSNQKSGGILEKAVQVWLEEKEYIFFQGRDRNGYSGAVLVKGKLEK